jgi:hypothetical protein
MTSVHLNISYLNKIPYIDVDDNGTSIGGLFGEMFTLVQSKLRFRVNSPEKLVDAMSILFKVIAQRAILNLTPGPQGRISPLGVNLAPRGEVHPFVHPQG